MTAVNMIDLFKPMVRRLLSRAIVRGGISALHRRLDTHDGAVILYGHRVAGNEDGFLPGLRPDWLDGQLAYLTSHYRATTLGQLVDAFEAGSRVEPRTVVLTFDDGFRDNHATAFPILKRYGVSATIFLVTGSITSGELPWPQRLGTLIQLTAAANVRDPLFGGERLSLRGNAVRERAFWRIFSALQSLSRDERDDALAELSTSLGVEAPCDRMLTWDQVREMRQHGFEFGAHTFSHPWLARISREEARWEMEKSRADLAEQLGVERPTFAFPGGSYDAELIQMAREVGFSCAFQSRPSLRYNAPTTTHQFALSRVGLPNAPAYILEAELDGPFHAIRRLYHR